MYSMCTTRLVTERGNLMASACFLLLCVVHSNKAFNLDTLTASVYYGPSGSMFGFAVALYKDHANSWSLVGAPTAQTRQPNVTAGGAVYRCYAHPSKECTRIPFDESGPTWTVDRIPEQIGNKSHQWFGATVGSTAIDGPVIACAPRYVYFSINHKRREPVGTCWIARDSLTSFEEYSPCRTDASGVHRQGSCQAGMSAAITEDGKRLFVGAVGSFYWQGQVFSKDLMTSGLNYQTAESPPEYDDSYLGYSTAVGEFTGDNNSDVAVGMPRGSDLNGTVVLLNSLMHVLDNITGDQLGAYFGYSVCVSDINGDGLDDVIVGAPLYTDLESKERKYEEGRVHVFHQNAKHKFSIQSTLDGEYTKGRFGLALASLKDINRDGYQDFAVGAPYAGKDEKGVVYIYHGSSKGIMLKPSQVITPQDFSDTGLSTLGFSLHGGIDMDSNEYPDIVIGAYSSDKAIFMRSRPVVNVVSSMIFSQNQISLDEKSCTRITDKTKVACINVTVILHYDGIGVSSELDVTLNMTLDAEQENPRAFVLHSEPSHEPKMVRLKKNVQYESTTTVYIQPGIIDKLSPILIQAEYYLVDHESYRYVLKPILNQNVPSMASKMLKIKKNCGDDDVCIPDLQLIATPNVREYTIGNGKRLEINVYIHNAGEDAFESMLFVKLPPDVNYVNINKSKLDFPVSCSGAQRDGAKIGELVCDIGNPLPANKTLNFAIILTPSDEVSSVTYIVFPIHVNSTNEELKESLIDNEAEIVLPVRVKVNLDVRGISEPAYVSLNYSEKLPAHIDRETDAGPEVTHTYEVENLGESHNLIREAEVFILWPTYTLDNKFLLYTMSQPKVKGKAQCEKAEDVNPRNLVEIRKRPKSQSYVSNLETKHQAHSSSGTSRQRLRRKADANESKESYWAHEDQNSLSDEEENTFDEELSCGATKCTLIRCTISNLHGREVVEFTIRSRLWRETYYELGVTQVQTPSKMVVRVTELPYGVDPTYIPPKVFKVSTKVSLVGVGFQPYAIPWWIIILAVCGGLLLLALLAVILWKLGFFKRKRVKEEKEKEMLYEKNGYHMVRGDAAL